MLLHASGGALCGCGTRIQEDFDVIDDVEVMIQDVRNDGGDLGDRRSFAPSVSCPARR